MAYGQNSSSSNCLNTQTYWLLYRLIIPKSGVRLSCIDITARTCHHRPVVNHNHYHSFHYYCPARSDADFHHHHLIPGLSFVDNLLFPHHSLTASGYATRHDSCHDLPLSSLWPGNASPPVLQSTYWILDQGPGIPEEERETVFRPFYQLENSRSHTTGGSGLGLAIVQQLCIAQGWIITLQPRHEGGTAACLEL
jgi:hypothetical protein